MKYPLTLLSMARDPSQGRHFGIQVITSYIRDLSGQISSSTTAQETIGNSGHVVSG